MPLYCPACHDCFCDHAMDGLEEVQSSCIEIKVDGCLNCIPKVDKDFKVA